MSLFDQLRRTRGKDRAYTDGVNDAERLIGDYLSSPTRIAELTGAIHPTRTRPRVSTEELATLVHAHLKREILG